MEEIKEERFYQMAKEINIQKIEDGISAVFPLDFTTNELIPQFIFKGL